MMRAIFSGVSGLKVHQQKMDVIGNNVANINTTAYKASRVTFSDIYSQTLSSATGADSSTGRGGTNAQQVGLGVGLAAIDTVMTEGSTESTGNVTDLSINGNGFFIVRNGSTGSYMFTRAGNFSIDENGNLTTSDGLNVYGWMDYGGTKQADGTYQFDTDKKVEAINIYSDSYNKNKKIIAAKETTNAVLSGSLDSGEDAVDDIDPADPPEAQYTTTMTIYDSLGNKHELEVQFTKSSVEENTDTGEMETTWFWSAVDGTDTSGGYDAALSDANGYIKFGEDGEIITDADGFSTTPKLTFTPDSGSGAGDVDFTLDFSNLTTTSGDTSVQASEVDGGPSGSLEDISIDSNGVIMGVYSNGQQQALGMVGIAQFDNAAGLQRAGSNNFIVSSNSGDFNNGVAANGILSSGSLEMSNVDLSNEFSQMIITQRGYQANSRIISTADEMLQTVLDIKR